jgi:uncharacterized protein YjbI with pentapeptide repeats
MSTTDTPPGLEPSEQNRPSANQPRTKWRKGTKVAVKLAPVLAILVAVWVATQGQVTVDRSNRATLRQSEDAQLSTAITAIGSNDTAEQIAGLLLLARNTSNRFTLMGQAEEALADVYGDYTTALQILSGYLRSHSDTLLTGNAQTAALFGRGYGLHPPSGIPLDITYAANQVKFLLATNMERKVGALNVGAQPAIDLSNDELIGQPWTNVNFGWIHAFMVGIDLRGASLESSQWSNNSDLAGSYLQCADLQNANFRGANLNGADLEGAYVQGADFRGANIKGAVFGQLYGKAKWSSQPLGIRTLSAHNWTSAACLQNASFWRGQPTPASTPTAVSSPAPSSSPTPKPSASTGK